MEYNFPPVPLIPANDPVDNSQSNVNLGGAYAPFGGAHLTDFTKRKNWPLRVLGELKDFLHVVSPSGKFLFCSPGCLEMVGYSPEELVGRNVSEFIHVDDRDTYIRDFNIAITQKKFLHFYRFRKKDDKFIVLETNGHPYFPEGSTIARCFFLMARPYPSKAASMMDSFLELRMENEILTRKLHELKRDVPDQNTQGDKIFNQPNILPLRQIVSHQPINTGSDSSLVNSLLSNVSFSAPLSSNNDPEIKTRKSKKTKPEDDVHVCTDCGTVDSPEWRRGPQGPKTLCNACGLRFAKRTRKTKDSSMIEEES